jgi:hypothetical protein
MLFREKVAVMRIIRNTWKDGQFIHINVSADGVYIYRYVLKCQIIGISSVKRERNIAICLFCKLKYVLTHVRVIGWNRHIL